MASDKFPELKELTLKAPNKGIISFIADEPIPMWHIVRIVSPPNVGDLPLVAIPSVANESSIIGIAVGGSGTAVNPDGTTGNAADAAGDVVDVAVLDSGVITKLVVNANVTTGEIFLGDTLTNANSPGLGVKILTAAPTLPNYVLGKAMQESTILGDTILVFLGGSF